jgi:hypothetical protein
MRPFIYKVRHPFSFELIANVHCQDYKNLQGVYQHPLIVMVIKAALFGSPRSPGIKHPEFFPDVLPLPTLALALTAVWVPHATRLFGFGLIVVNAD